MQGARRFGNYPFEKIQPIVDRLQTLGEAHGGKTPAQVAQQQPLHAQQSADSCKRRQAGLRSLQHLSPALLAVVAEVLSGESASSCSALHYQHMRGRAAFSRRLR